MHQQPPGEELIPTSLARLVSRDTDSVVKGQQAKQAKPGIDRQSAISPTAREGQELCGSVGMEGEIRGEM